jgi:hypothetical protein
MFVAEAARDQFARIRESIGRFVAEARQLGAPVQLRVQRRAGHGFDNHGAAREVARERQADARVPARRSLLTRTVPTAAEADDDRHVRLLWTLLSGRRPLRNDQPASDPA